MKNSKKTCCAKQQPNAAEIQTDEFSRRVAAKPQRDLISAEVVAAQLLKKFMPKRNMVGLKTGIECLDRLTGGLCPGELVLLASRPCVGKTALAANIVYHACVKKNVPAAFFSLDLGRESLFERILSAAGRVEIHKLRHGFFCKQEWSRISKEIDLLASSPFYVDDTPAISIEEICIRSCRLAGKLKKQGKELGLIVVDYLQLVKPLACPQNELKSRLRELEETAELLKDLGRRLHVPVVVLSQLSKKSAAQKQADDVCNDRRPQFSDVRAIGGDVADAVILIHRESYYKRNDESLRNKAELILAKHPRAFSHTLELDFFSEYGQFVDGGGFYNGTLID